MTAAELQHIQNAIRFDGKSMSLSLGITYDEYRHLRSGHAKITPAIERAVVELVQINQEFTLSAPARIDAGILGGL